MNFAFINQSPNQITNLQGVNDFFQSFSCIAVCPETITLTNEILLLIRNVLWKEKKKIQTMAE